MRTTSEYRSVLVVQLAGTRLVPFFICLFSLGDYYCGKASDCCHHCIVVVVVHVVFCS